MYGNCCSGELSDMSLPRVIAVAERATEMNGLKHTSSRKTTIGDEVALDPLKPTNSNEAALDPLKISYGDGR